LGYCLGGKMESENKIVPSTVINKSEDDMELNFIIEEYKTLRDEVISRLESQHQIINIALILIVAIIAATQYIDNIPATSSLIIFIKPFIIISSIIFSAFSMSYLENDILIAHIGKYINGQLRKRIAIILETRNCINTSVLEWDDFRGNQENIFPKNYFHGIMSLSRYFILLFSSLLPILYFIYKYGVLGSVIISILLLIAFIYILLMVIGFIYGVIEYTSRELLGIK
jgi:hypothetical protein